jgi:hypothetical protein
MNNKFNRFVILIILVFLSSSVYAQAVASDAGVVFLYPNETNATLTNVRRGAYAGTHAFGEDIANKLDEFEKNYVYYKKSQGAYATEEKIVLKQPIYKAIKKMDKFYTKKALQEPQSFSEVTTKYSTLLDIGNKLMKYNTTQVEAKLKKMKDPLEIEKYFLSLSFR